MSSADLSTASNVQALLNQYRPVRAAELGIDPYQYENPFELMHVVLSKLDVVLRANLEELRENLRATEVDPQQTQMRLTEAEKAFPDCEAELNRVTQWSHQLIVRILDAIR